MPKRTCTIHGHSPLVAGIPPTNLRVLWFTTWFKLSAVLILLSCTFSTANGLPQYPVICANFRDFRAPVFQVAFKAIFFVFLFTLTLKRSDLPCTLNVFGASMELQYLASTCSFSSIIITNVFLNKITQNKVFKKAFWWAKLPKKQSEGVRFLLILHSCQKYTPTNCFFGNFAHLVVVLSKKTKEETKGKTFNLQALHWWRKIDVLTVVLEYPLYLLAIFFAFVWQLQML